MPEHDTDPSPVLTRRAVVGGAAVLGAGILVAGCASAGTSGRQSTAAPGTPLGPETDVPVGGAKIFDDQGMVVTQATAGTFTGFSTICPHQGCRVASVERDHIICPCHGSTFALDGSVVEGPATTGLTPHAIAVAAGQITIA